MWEDEAASIGRASALIENAATEPGDLVVLPEMYATGFSMNTAVTADAGAGFLRDTAASLRCTVVGGVTRLGPTGAARNRALVVGPRGEELAVYDKVHLFTPGKEPGAFEPGSSVALFEWAGLRVQPVVCYDLRFPELFRAGLAAGAQAAVVIANWPEARGSHWRALAIARAIENQEIVIAVNRAGADPYQRYAGGSLVVGPRGDVLGEAGDAETVLSVEIDPGVVRSWRDEFPAWREGSPCGGLSGPVPGDPGHPAPESPQA